MGPKSDAILRKYVYKSNQYLKIGINPAFPRLDTWPQFRC